MKMRALLKNRPVRLGLVIVLSAFLFLSHQRSQRIFYPTYDVMTDCATGKPVPEIADWLLPKTDIDGQTCIVDLGSMPGDVQYILLQYFSYTISMIPNERVFLLKWFVHYPGYSGETTLEYNRRTGEFFEVTDSNLNSGLRKRIGRNLTDKDVHDAALSSKLYSEWANEHWK